MTRKQIQPIVLILDTSASMQGDAITKLNQALSSFAKQGIEHKLDHVRIAVISHGPVILEHPFGDFEDLQHLPQLIAQNDRPTGECIKYALDYTLEYCRNLRELREKIAKPWLILITDSKPNDDCDRARELIHEYEHNNDLAFFPVGIRRADLRILGQLSVRKPQKINDLEFNLFFDWLVHSLDKMTHDNDNTFVTPFGWTQP